MAIKSVVDKKTTGPKAKGKSPFGRRISMNGPIAKRLAGDFPRYIQGEDGQIDELNDGERAIMRFFRAIPEDTRPEFVAIMRIKEIEAFKYALVSFQDSLLPRRSEMGDWFGEQAS